MHLTARIREACLIRLSDHSTFWLLSNNFLLFAYIEGSLAGGRYSVNMRTDRSILYLFALQYSAVKCCRPQKHGLTTDFDMYELNGPIRRSCACSVDWRWIQSFDTFFYIFIKETSSPRLARLQTMILCLPLSQL